MIDGEGPCPDKAGEFCGNYMPGNLPWFSFRQSPKEAARHQREYLDRMRFGKPSTCEAGTSSEMAARGWVGLYLKEDHKLFEWETPVETGALTEAVVSAEPA
jgi:hypothetical protein